MMAGDSNNEVYVEKIMRVESEFEKFVFDKQKVIFGDDALLLQGTVRFENQGIRGTIPDGILFDLSDKMIPKLHLVEVEMRHSQFYGLVFPQITRFLSFIMTKKGRFEITRVVCQRLADETNKEILKNLRSILKIEDSIFLFEAIKEMVENAKILVVVDSMEEREHGSTLDEKFQMMREIYTLTWAKLIDTMVVKRLQSTSDSSREIVVVDPEFRKISLEESDGEGKRENAEDLIGATGLEEPLFDEWYHISDVDEQVRLAYSELKKCLTEINQEIQFIPRKHRISVRTERNIALLRFSKKKMEMVILAPLDRVERAINSCVENDQDELQVYTLSEAVQRFFAGEGSCRVFVSDSSQVSLLAKVLGNVFDLSR